MDTGVTVRTSGHGPDVVLVHGALGDYRQWDAIGAGLARDFRVTAISRRHHWPNTPEASGARYSTESHAEDLRAVLDDLGRPAHVVGHSYGGGVALFMALRDARRIRSLVLIEPGVPSLLPVDDPSLQGELVSRREMAARLDREVAAGQRDAASITLMDWVQGGAGRFETLPEDVRRALLDNAATIGPTFSAPRPDIDCDTLRALAVPTLVLHGERTRVYYRRICEIAAQCIPGATLQMIPGCAHMSIVEAPDAVVEILRPFLGAE